MSLQRLVIVALIALVVAVALAAQAAHAMSARDAFEEARKKHRGDPNFNTNFNPTSNAQVQHPGLMGGRFGSVEAPVYDTMNMPHAPGGDF